MIAKCMTCVKRRSTTEDDVRCCTRGAEWSELKDEVFSHKVMFQLCCVALSGAAVRGKPEAGEQSQQ